MDKYKIIVLIVANILVLVVFTAILCQIYLWFGWVVWVSFMFSYLVLKLANIQRCLEVNTTLKMFDKFK